MGMTMRRSIRHLLGAATIALGAGLALAASTTAADARGGHFFLGIGLPPLYLGPPAYYYPPAPPPAYYAPPPAYYGPPPCHPRYDWRWNGYRWYRAYVGCW
jgi:hypothetical protein